MAQKHLIVALSVIAAASPISAATVQADPAAMAPPGGPQTEYCLRVGPVTGQLAETVQCWTREQWVDQGVDIDAEWAKEGVSDRG